jgi:hypothetical protein
MEIGGSKFEPLLTTGSAEVRLKETGAEHSPDPTRRIGQRLEAKQVTKLPTSTELREMLGSPKEWVGIPVRSTGYRRILRLVDEYHREKEDELAAQYRWKMGRTTPGAFREKQTLLRIKKLERKLSDLISTADSYQASSKHTRKEGIADFRQNAVNELKKVQRLRRDWTSKQQFGEPLPTLNAEAIQRGLNMSVRRFDYNTLRLPWRDLNFDATLDEYHNLKYSQASENLPVEDGNQEQDIIADRLDQLRTLLQKLQEDFQSVDFDPRENPVEIDRIKAFSNGISRELRAIDELKEQITKGQLPTQPLADAIDRLWYGEEVFRGPVKANRHYTRPGLRREDSRCNLAPNFLGWLSGHTWTNGVSAGQREPAR